MSEEANRSRRRNAAISLKDKSKNLSDTISGGALNVVGVTYETDPYVSPQANTLRIEQAKKQQRPSAVTIETSGNDEKYQKSLSGARKRLELG